MSSQDHEPDVVMEEKRNCGKRLRRIKEHGGTSCKLFWSNLRGMKKNRMMERLKAKDGGVVEGEDEV